MKRPATISTFCAVLCGLLIAPSVLADSVGGTFDLDGMVLAPTSVVAFRMRDETNPREFVTQVMLSTAPMNREAIADAVDPYQVAINDESVMRADYLAFQVNADGTVGMNAHVGGTQYIDSSGELFDEPGSLVSACSVNTAAQVACTVKSAKRVKTASGAGWTVDVQFDSVVLERARGEPLPKDGGEPGKVLAQLVKAAQGDDLAAIVALLIPSEAESYQRDYNTPEQNLASAKQLLGFSLPKQHRITGGELRDADTALLEVEGVPFGTKRGLYIVTMQRTDGRWGYASSTLAGLLE